jgi:hypothetical protein
MSSPKQIFDETFLTMRSKLIDIAANLDRIDRAAGGGEIDDPRRARIEEAIEILSSETVDADRAKRLQQLFSRSYDAKWRREFGL